MLDSSVVLSVVSELVSALVIDLDEAREIAYRVATDPRAYQADHPLKITTSNRVAFAGALRALQDGYPGGDARDLVQHMIAKHYPHHDAVLA